MYIVIQVFLNILLWNLRNMLKQKLPYVQKDAALLSRDLLV